MAFILGVIVAGPVVGGAVYLGASGEIEQARRETVFCNDRCHTSQDAMQSQIEATTVAEARVAELEVRCRGDGAAELITRAECSQRRIEAKDMHAAWSSDKYMPPGSTPLDCMRAADAAKAAP